MNDDKQAVHILRRPLKKAAAVLAAGLTACAADEAAERVSGSLPKPQTAEPAGTGEEALKIRNALPETARRDCPKAY